MKGGHNGYGNNRRMYCGTINSYSRVERMNKFNTQKQTEETTEFQDNEVMHELNNEQQFTSMAHKRRVERLQKEVNKEKPKEETEYGFFLAKRG